MGSLMGESALQTPILRHYSTLYCLLGIQLGPFTKWTDWRWWTSLCWNLSLNTAVLAGLWQLNSGKLGKDLASFEHLKPLFSGFVTLGLVYLFRITFICNVAYYLLYGRQIMRALDVEPFARIYRTSHRAKRIFLLVATVQIAVFATFPLFVREWRAHLCMYLANLYHYLLYGILYYTQDATLYQLKQYEQMLTSKRISLNDEKTILNEIALLALANNRLNQLISFPMIIFLMTNVYKITMCLCLAWLTAPLPTLVIQSIIIIANVIHLILLNTRVVESFGIIFSTVRARHECDTIRSLDRTKLFNGNLDLYLPYFRLSVYQAFAINFPFILQIALFILNYVVFMTQTN